MAAGSHVVLVELKAEGKLSLELRHQVNHASGQPLYDVRLTEDNGKTVCHQIPVSRHELVRVRRQDVTPKPNEETDMGEIKWTLALAPNETREIRFGFTIEQPRNLPLTACPL